MNGQLKKRGVDFQSGIETDTGGTETLVIWLPLSATEPVSFEISKQ